MDFYRNPSELVPTLRGVIETATADYPPKPGMSRKVQIDHTTGSVKVSQGRYLLWAFEETEHRVYPDLLGPLVELPTPDWMGVDEDGVGEGGKAYLCALWCRRADLEATLRAFVAEALATNL